MEVAEARMGSAHSSQKDKATEKKEFWEEALESKATSPLRVINPSGHRMWNKKFKNPDEQARWHARQALQWLDPTKHMLYVPSWKWDMQT